MIRYPRSCTAIIGMAVIFVMQVQQASTVRILKREVGGCVCSDFTWFRNENSLVSRHDGIRNTIRGTFLGGCRSRDEDGHEFCYVHQPNNCDDAKASVKFDGLDVSTDACDCRFNRFGQCSNAGGRRGASFVEHDDGMTEFS